MNDIYEDEAEELRERQIEDEQDELWGIEDEPEESEDDDDDQA